MLKINKAIFVIYTSKAFPSSLRWPSPFLVLSSLSSSLLSPQPRQSGIGNRPTSCHTSQQPPVASPTPTAAASRAPITLLCSPPPVLYIQPYPTPPSSNVAGLLLAVDAGHPPASLPSPDDLQVPSPTIGCTTSNHDVLQTPQLPCSVFPSLLFLQGLLLPATGNPPPPVVPQASAAIAQRHHCPSLLSLTWFSLFVGRWKPKSHLFAIFTCFEY